MVPAIAPSTYLLETQSYNRRLGEASPFSMTLKNVLRGQMTTAVTTMPPLAVFGPDEQKEDDRDRSARRDAKAILDELAQIQRELLGPGVTPARLLRVANLAAGLSPADHGLAEICTAITIRARIEAARSDYPLPKQFRLPRVNAATIATAQD